MKDEIKILILEDVITDLELVKNELTRNDINFTYLHVITKEEFISGLKDFKPDIILSDYTLPQFDGLAALKITKELSPTTPFIIVTGSINEETAVACIKSGAEDYIVKGHYQRLGAAVKSALEKKEIKLQQEAMQKELSESEERFRSIFEQAAVGIIYADLDGRFLQVNDRFCEIMKCKSRDANKYTLADVIHPDDFKNDMALLEQIVQGKIDKLVEDRRIIKTDGSIGWVNISISLLRDQSSEPLYFIGIVKDISTRVAAENALKQSELRFRSIIESANDAIIIADREGKIISWNQGVQKIFGYSKEEIINKPVTLLMPEKYRSNHDDHMNNFLISGKGTAMGSTVELEGLKKEGTIFPIELSLSHWITGREIFFSGIIRDISDRKEAEKALSESEERFRSLFENATVGIYRTTPDGKVLMANPRLVNMLGYCSEDELLVERSQMDCYLDKNKGNEFKKIIESDGTIYGFEAEWLTSIGTKIWIRESAKVIKDNEGNSLFYDGVVEDITDVKIAELALIEAKERAEKSDKLKSEFLAQMSHEIRTPINAMLNFAELLKEDVHSNNTEYIDDEFAGIEFSGKRIIRTIDLILNMSEIQTGTYEPILKQINLYSDILKKLMREFKTFADSKKLELNIFESNVDSIVLADEYSVTQIFANLIDNAIKYTDKGKVDIYMKKNEKGECLVEVTDTGIGISKEFIPRLFSTFVQEHQGYTRRFEGNGLGLALVKKYCEINNAEVYVESKKDFGTTFTIVFNKQ